MNFRRDPNPPENQRPPTRDPDDTFARRYCAMRGLEREAFVEAVLRETLYPHVRLLHRLLPPSSFAIDRAFLENIGRLRRRREFNDKFLDFAQDPAGGGWMRDLFYLRISVGRLHELVWLAFAPAPPTES